MIGRILQGTYKILDEVGRGGIATVYLARNLQTGETVAVKIIHQHIAASEKTFLQRFQREAALLSSLSSPHIPRVYASGLEDGLYFMVMEYVQGISIADLIKQQKQLDVELSLDILRQTAEALQITYEQGIVHRDIKPANLMITVDNVVKVMDFGIARSIEGAGLTQTGFLGTPNYISPEQADGKDTDIRSDLYSLGASLFEMLSGRILYTGDSPISVAIKHISAAIPQITQYREDVPQNVQDLLVRCLAKQPFERYQTPAELIMHINEIIGPPKVTAGHSLVRQAYADGLSGTKPALEFTMTAPTVEDRSRLTTTIKCPGCEAAIPAAAVFCPKCGLSIPAEATKVAGATVVDNGHGSSPVAVASSTTGVSVATKKGGSTPILIGGGAVMLVLVLGVGLLVLRSIGSASSPTPVTTVKVAAQTVVAGVPTTPAAQTSLPGQNPKQIVAEGDGLALQSRYDDAVERYKRAIEIDSLNASAYIQWGRVLAWMGNPIEAIPKLEKATKLATTDQEKAMANGQLARAYDWTYKFKDALKTAQDAVQFDPNNAEAHAFLGEVLLNCIDSGDCQTQADLDMVEVELRAALKMDEKNAEALTVQAAMERKKGRMEPAVIAARKAIDSQPNVSLWHFNLGTLYLENGNYELANVALKRSIELYGKFASAYFALGQSYKAQNRCREAIPQFEEALKIDPKYSSALNAVEECRRLIK